MSPSSLQRQVMLTCDVLHFWQAAVKPVHGLQELSAMALSLERRQDQHLAVQLKGIEGKKIEKCE